VATLAEFLGRERSDLLADVEHLISAGTVVVRGRRARVVPDVLADEVLTSRAVAAGADTGFVSGLWAAFAPTRASDLLRSLAELDWRISALAKQDGDSSAPDLFSSIWSDISAQVVGDANAGRYAALSRLEPVAATQPERVFELVTRVLDQPQHEVDESSFTRFTHVDVQRAAAPLIRTCAAATPELLAESLDRLWDLARVDPRPPNQDGNHPARLLEDIAQLGSNDAATTATLLEAVERWLAIPDVPRSPRTPVEILTPLVAKSGYTTDPGHRSIAMHPYLIAPGKVRSLRDQVRGLLERTASDGPVRRTVSAVEVLCTALHEPVGYFGQSVPDEAALEWEDDDLASIDSLQRIAETTSEPLVRLCMRDQLDWLARYSHSPAVRTAAFGVATSVDDHTEDLLTDVVRGGWSPVIRRGARAALTGFQVAPDSPSASGSSNQANSIESAELDDYAQMDYLRDQERAYVIRALTRHSLTEALHIVGNRVGVLQGAEPSRSQPGMEELIRGLAVACPAEVPSAIQALLDVGESPLDPWVRALADELSHQDPAVFLGLLPQLTAARAPLSSAVIAGFALHGWVRRIPESSTVLQAALDDPDPEIQAVAWSATSDLLANDPLAWAPRLASAAINHPAQVAAAVAGVSRRAAAPWVSGLDTDQQSALLELLSALPSWDHQAQKLVSALAVDKPAEVLTLLSDRRLRPLEELRGISGLPLAISRHPGELRSWVGRGASQPEHIQFELGRIWPLVAGRPLTAEARDVAREVVNSGTEAEVVFLAISASHDDGFAVREVPLTGALVDRISGMAEPQRSRAALSSLKSTIHPTSYSRAPGEASQDRITRRDQARAAAVNPDLSTATQSFYTESAAVEQHLIDQDLSRDQEEDDAPW
jgi:hypothetical protein